MRRSAAACGRGRVQHGVHGDRRGPSRVRRQEWRGALHVLPGRQTKHVQHAVARDHVADAGGARQEPEAAAAFFPARRSRNPIGRLRRRAPRDLVAARWRGGAAPRPPPRAPGAALFGAGEGSPPARPAPRAFERHALPGLAEQAAIADRAAPAAEPRKARDRSVEPHDARRASADAAWTARRRCGQRDVEPPLPDDVAEVVVDAVDVVRAAGHERHRHEQRHAARRHALSEAVHAARLVIELRCPLQLEAGLRQRRHRDLVVGAHPRRALRIAQRRQPLRAAAADLGEREASGQRRRSRRRSSKAARASRFSAYRGMPKQ